MRGPRVILFRFVSVLALLLAVAPLTTAADQEATLTPTSTGDIGRGATIPPLERVVEPEPEADPAAVRPAATDGAVRTIILYATDPATAEMYHALLDGNGFSVQVHQVAPPELTVIFLPLVVRGHGGALGASPGVVHRLPASPAGSVNGTPGRPAAMPDFSKQDLVIVGPDTGLAAAWSSEPGLVDAIMESGLPVAGLGRGGHAFFGQIGLEIGYPAGKFVSASAVQVADFGDSQPFYSTPNPISLPGDGVLALFDSDQSSVAIPLSERLPEGVRVAALAGVPDQYPIMKSGASYLLWGFGGGPADMTASGQALFANSLWALVRRFTIPLRSRHVTPQAGVDEDLLAALRETGLPNLHALAQLKHLPTPAEQEALQAAGVVLLSFLDGTTYVATVDTGMDPRDSAIVELVRWMGLILPADNGDRSLPASNTASFISRGPRKPALPGPTGPGSTGPSTPASARAC